MLLRLVSLCGLCLISTLTLHAQIPGYTAKHFVNQDNVKEFVRIVPKKDGLMRTYLLTDPEIFDIDDNNTTFVTSSDTVLICIEGPYKKGKREGKFSTYIIDDADHSKHNRIYEQSYLHDKLEGEWAVYTLRGTLVSTQAFTGDSLNGISRKYWIDGKTITRETEYFNGNSKFIDRRFAQGGHIIKETTYVNGLPNGIARRFYPTGVLEEEVTAVNGKLTGLRKYYYPSGKLWLEREMKDGKPWAILGNYTEDGQRRPAGTLKDGTGTIILYNEDGTVREVTTYENGVEIK